MLDNDLIVDFRKQALYYTNPGKRFKILIETVTGCYGSCLGCAFTADDRNNFEPKISKDNLSKMFNRLSELLDYNNPNSIVSEYETTVINYGGSEHFIYDADYLDYLFKETADFFNNKVHTKRNVLAFSSSGLMSKNKMLDRTKAVAKHLNKEQYVVDFVIDLARFDKLKEKYQENFDFFREQFGFIDLAVNLESQSNTRDWDSFCKFVDQNGVLNIDLIYALNKNNVSRVQLDSKNIFQIYEKVVLNTTGGKSLFDIQNLLRVKEEDDNKSYANLEIKDIIKATAKNLLKDAIYINEKLDVYPVLFVVFADVPLADRADVPAIGNLMDVDFKEKFIKYEETLTNILFKTLIQSVQCEDCPIKLQCYETGAPILNKFLPKFKSWKLNNHENCQNPVKYFIEAKNKKYLILKENEIE